MKETSSSRRAITVAKRGQIVQRVIVDGWTTAKVAATFGVPQCLVETWVAEFRRTGMASLRDRPSRIVPADLARLRVSLVIRRLWRKISIGLRPLIADEPSAQPLPLRRSREDGSD